LSPGWRQKWSRSNSLPPVTPDYTGSSKAWAAIFLLLTVALAVLMMTEPTGLFLMLSTIATAVLVVAGTGASTLWFLSVLRRLGLRLRFAPA
jgi:hypothetical protein